MFISTYARGGCPVADEYFQGLLDEPRLWNVARDAADIQADLYRRLGGTEAGLVACWPFDEGVGLAAADASTAGNHAALGGGSDAQAPAWTAYDVPVERATLRIGYDDLVGLDAATVTDKANYHLVASGEDGDFTDGDEVDLPPTIAGARYVPFHIRAAFWQRFESAA